MYLLWKRRQLRVASYFAPRPGPQRPVAARAKADIESFAGAKAGFPIIADESLAVAKALDALQATYGVPIATPANWEHGQDVIVALSLSDEQAREKFGEINVKLPYLRTTRLKS